MSYLVHRSYGTRQSRHSQNPSNLLNQEGDVGCISCSIRTSHIELNGVAVNVTNDDGLVHE